ncbi:hypothetical protein GS398_21645 [Pedobacter sp. HMF7056]|uniref:Outer membrane beta-barrel protein n=2 Tax=Hufsiella ginkgonis TaxID=2695274 RepID=A0A7K1Y3Q8_9SPHI|nr:hypothetical protein [Hufsiella ginkgonis]
METKAQEYKNALGVRLGSYNGVNFKTFVSKDNAFDLNLSFRNTSARKDVRFTVLYEFHNPVQNAPGLKWFYGGGGSIGSRRYVNDDGQLFLSAVGTLGLDYTFTGAPINLGLDWRPQLVITPDTDVTAGDVGLAVRFTF